ncbi:MAG: hypothetical protein AAGI54_11750 [Planctomycetota bacterium]
MSDTPPPASTAPRPARKKWIVRAGLAVGAIVLLLIVLVLAAPTLLSTGPGNGVLLGIANGRIPGTAQAKSISVGWFSGPAITDLQLDDPSGQPVVKVGSLTMPNTSLLKLASGDLHLGEINLTDLSADIVADDKGRTNLEDALSKPSQSGTSSDSKDKKTSSNQETTSTASSQPTKISLPTFTFTGSNIDVTYRQSGVPDATLNVPKIELASNNDRSLVANTDGQVALGDDTGKFAIDLTVRNAVAQDGELQIDQASVSGTANLDKLPIDAIDRIGGFDGALIAALGDPDDPDNLLSLDLDADLTDGATTGSATLVATAPRLKANITAKPDAGGTIVGDGSTIDYTLSTQLVATIAQQMGVDLGIDGDKQIKLDLTTLRIPEDGNPANGSLAFTLTSDDITFSGDPAWNGLRLSSLQVVAETMTLDDPKPITLTAALDDTSQQIAATQVTATATLAKPTDDALPTGLDQIDATLTPIPMELVERFTGEQPALVALLDQPQIDRLRVTVKGDPTATPLPVLASLNAGNLVANAVATYDESGLTVHEGTTSKLTLTPTRFADLLNAISPPDPQAGETDSSQMASAAIVEDVTLDVAVSSALIPLPFSLADVAIDATASTPMLAIARPNESPQRITNTQIDIDSSRLADQIGIKLSGNVVTTVPPAGNNPGSTADAAQIASDTTVRNVVNALGEVDINQLTLTTDSKLMSLPIGLVDRFSDNELLLEPILGSFANVTLNGDFPGNMAIRADSPTANLTADVRVDNQRRLLLNNDLVATLHVTPEMSEQFLGKVHPMFQDAESSDQPVTLTVSKDMRRIPLTGFDIKDLRLKGSVDGGVINLTRSGWLNGSLTDATAAMLKALSFGIIRPVPDTNKKTYPATFTPMDFTLKDNIFDASQAWVVSDDLAVGFIGTVNLKNLNDPKIVNMAMGVLTASLIVERPELSPFLQPTQVAELPLKGTVNDPEPEFDVLTTDLAGAGIVGTLNTLTGGLVGNIAQNLANSLRKEAKHNWKIPSIADPLIQKAENASIANDDKDLNEQQLQQRNQRRNTVDNLLDSLRNGDRRSN